MSHKIHNAVKRNKLCVFAQHVISLGIKNRTQNMRIFILYRMGKERVLTSFLFTLHFKAALPFFKKELKLQISVCFHKELLQTYLGFRISLMVSSMLLNT